MRALSQDEIKVLENIQKSFGGKVTTAIYARKSKEDLSNEALSTQVKQCEDFIDQNKKYLNLKKTYQEDNVSGMTVEGRAEFKKLIEAVDDGFIQAVVVSKWDRFSRNTTDLKNYRESFGKKGTLVITIEDSGEMSAVANLQFEIMAAINQYYVHKIAEDTKAVLINKTSKGHSGGGVANYGYEFDENNFLIIRAEEAVVVADIYDKFELGYSYNDIISDLKNRNIKTRKGNEFTKSTIRDILTNVKYSGVYRYNREDRKQSDLVKKSFDEVWVEDGIKEPIVTKKQFEEVQKIIDIRKTIYKDSEYLLTGIIECELCHTGMVGSSQSTGKGKPRRRQYICPNHLKVNGKTCTSKGIDALTIENQVQQIVLDTINAFIKTDSFDKTIFKDSLESKRRLKKSINKSIANINQAIEIATDRLVEPGIRDAIKKSLEKKIEKDSNHIEELKIKLALANKSINQYSQIVNKKEIDSFTAEDLLKNKIIEKQLTRVIVDCVKIGPENIEIKILEK
ncbi:recombinase family protein [Mariniplasma anaerobium]|uniref:Serine recombinase n=1 Tax=Mariniplasma anaerobium TaxID=2735436 RepID=A0A7U9TKB6_9MOLU|nr:recombinase family protein [Mariniplasma anaerobium]BCR35198.1 serine recombinase [Mariniplasma anaerobium]